MTDHEKFKETWVRQGLLSFIENGCLVGVVLVSILIWFYLLYVEHFSIGYLPTIDSQYIYESSEWEGPFDKPLPPPPVDLCGAAQYEKRTGKAAISFSYIDFTEIRAIPDREYQGEYPPMRQFVYTQSKITLKKSVIIIAIILNVSAIIGLLSISRYIHNRLQRIT
jgi:hypothetical protein